MNPAVAAKRAQTKRMLATPHQRMAIRCGFRELELPTDQVTLLHRTHFRRAGLPDPTPGTDVDSHLCAMTRAEASRLIDALKAALPE